MEMDADSKACETECIFPNVRQAPSISPTRLDQLDNNPFEKMRRLE